MLAGICDSTHVIIKISPQRKMSAIITGKEKEIQWNNFKKLKKKVQKKEKIYLGKYMLFVSNRNVLSKKVILMISHKTLSFVNL
jgi:effector-binding domain-containing protein